MAPDPDPPMAHLRMELTVDADDISDLWHRLRTIANDLDHDGREEREVVSGGYHFKIQVRSDLTAEQYEDALIEWHDTVVANRRAEAASPTDRDLANFVGLCTAAAVIAGGALVYGVRRWLTVKAPRGGWG